MTKDLTTYRDLELRSRFQDIRDSGVNKMYYNWKLVVRMLSKQPAPQFYISPKKAEQYVHSYYRGEFLVKSSLARAMVRDLVDNYERIIAERNGKKMCEIWEMVVESPAKSFYLKESTIRHIIYEYLRPHTNQRKSHRR